MRIAYFANTGTVIFSKAALDLVDCWGDIGELRAVYLLSLGAHAGDGQDLSILDAALLQLAEQDSKTCGLSVIAILIRPRGHAAKVTPFPTCSIIAGPKAVLEGRHCV